jgi:hypothetical protein
VTRAANGQAGAAGAVGRDDDVRRVVELFLDGEAQGDAGKLLAASLPDARVFGRVGDERFDVGIAAFARLAVQQPRDPIAHRARIVSVEQAGDAAVAVVVGEAYRGAVPSTDFFQLARADGEWKVVSKLLAHTGDHLPAPA